MALRDFTPQQIVPAADSRPGIMSPAAIIEREIARALETGPRVHAKGGTPEDGWGPLLNPENNWFTGQSHEETGAQMTGLQRMLRSIPGSLLPFEEHERGGIRPAIPTAIPGAIQGLADMLSLPQRVAQNEGGISDLYVDPETGANFQPGIMDAAVGMTGAMGGAGMATAPFRPGLAAFGGPLAATADLAARDRAVSMKMEGLDRTAIRRETGWFQGRDGQWRFETPGVGEIAPTIKYGEWQDLQNAYRDPGLFEAYPQMAGISTFIPEQGSLSGNVADNLGNTRYMDPFAWGDVDIQVKGGNLLSVLGHEVQHPIQRAEGFDPGGNWNDPRIAAAAAEQDLKREIRQRAAEEAQGIPRGWGGGRNIVPYDLYHVLAGETEARNAALRTLYPDIRQAPPWITQDVPSNRQWLWSDILREAGR